MTTQTKTLQKRILEAAKPEGYADLFWFVEASAPGHVRFPGAYPGRLIPVVEVAPDPEVTRHWAHLLAVLFSSTNPPIYVFAPALTSTEALRETGCQWYRWGEIDVICEVCGAVGWDSCSCQVVRRVEA